MASVRARLREAISERAAPLAPGVYDGLSAALTSAAGFKVAYMSGAAVSVVTGVPDIGLATQTEMAQRVQLISFLLDIPLVADADTGFGDVTNVYRTVRLYERAGAAAIQFEDQEFPNISHRWRPLRSPADRLLHAAAIVDQTGPRSSRNAGLAGRLRRCRCPSSGNFGGIGASTDSRT